MIDLCRRPRAGQRLRPLSFVFKAAGKIPEDFDSFQKLFRYLELSFVPLSGSALYPDRLYELPADNATRHVAIYVRYLWERSRFFAVKSPESSILQ